MSSLDMALLKDLTGQIFGKLTVVSLAEPGVSEGGRKAVRWKAICQCGNTTIVRSNGLLYSGTKSCGCLRQEGLNKKPAGTASFNARFGSYGTWAKRRGLAFDLTKENFREITNQPCHYCGTENSINHTANGCNGPFIGNGIDRIDSSKGYFIENCVPCCSSCNKMKLDLPYDAFIEHVKRIFNHMKKV